MDYHYNNNVRIKKDTEFLQYLKSSVLSEEALNLVCDIEQRSEVIVFSGVIRDYLLNRNATVRDVDFTFKGVIEGDLFLTEAIESHLSNRNSFGGYKLSAGALIIDIWPVEKTWGLVQQKKKPTIENLIKTAFFNFSAVAYSIEKEEFYIHKAFDDFLLKKEIDVVYEDNPNIPLCILNSMYYSEILKMRTTNRLSQWLFGHYDAHYDYKNVQLQHWGRVLYSDNDVSLFCNPSAGRDLLRFNREEKLSAIEQLCLFANN